MSISRGSSCHHSRLPHPLRLLPTIIETTEEPETPVLVKKTASEALRTLSSSVLPTERAPTPLINSPVIHALHLEEATKPNWVMLPGGIKCFFIDSRPPKGFPYSILVPALPSSLPQERLPASSTNSAPEPVRLSCEASATFSLLTAPITLYPERLPRSVSTEQPIRAVIPQNAACGGAGNSPTRVLIEKTSKVSSAGTSTCARARAPVTPCSRMYGSSVSAPISRISMQQEATSGGAGASSLAPAVSLERNARVSSAGSVAFSLLTAPVTLHPKIPGFSVSASTVRKPPEGPSALALSSSVPKSLLATAPKLFLVGSSTASRVLPPASPRSLAAVANPPSLLTGPVTLHPKIPPGYRLSSSKKL